MNRNQSAKSNFTWLRPFLLVMAATLFVAGCKSSVIQPPGGMGAPSPPSGGLPSPGGGSSGGGESGGESGGQSGGGSSGGGSSGGGSSGGGSSGGGSSGGGSSGGGSSDGGSSSSGGSSGGDGQSGGVGSVPQVEFPAPGGFPGMGGGADGDGADGEGGDGDGDGEGGGDCGDTGQLPGGVGGMGQAGECLGGGGGASDSAESESAGGGAGEGGAAGGGGDGTGTGGAGSAGQFPGESDAERAERLGRELEESIGGFDEVLSEEQREIASVGRNTEGFGGGGGGSGGGAAGISLGEQAAGGTGAGSVAVINQPEQKRESPVVGMSDEEIRERTPDDIPVIVDDDIIARQLREAALAEEDEELRERLWEEYRKYSGI